MTLVAVRADRRRRALHRGRLVFRHRRSCRRGGVRGRRPLSRQGARDRTAGAARGDRRRPRLPPLRRDDARRQPRDDRGVPRFRLRGPIEVGTRRRRGHAHVDAVGGGRDFGGNAPPACDRGLAAPDARAARGRGRRRVARSGKHRPPDSRRADRRRLHGADLSDQSGRDRNRRPARLPVRPRRPRGRRPRGHRRAARSRAGGRRRLRRGRREVAGGDHGRLRRGRRRGTRARSRSSSIASAATACGWSAPTAWDCSTPIPATAAERLVLAAVPAAGPRRDSRRRAARSGWRSSRSPADRGVGLSTFVSVGNKADVSSNDLLEYWEEDAATRVILLYLESFGNPRRFARLARRIGRTKPIVAVKAGRTRGGSRAAGSHTAALAANDTAVDALFHQAGVIRADTIDEMFDVAACLDAQPLPADGAWRSSPTPAVPASSRSTPASRSS